MQTKITIPVTKPFDFHSALKSHGWVDLPPNSYNETDGSFSRTHRLQSGSVVGMNVFSPNASGSEIRILVEHQKKITQKEIDEIRRDVRYMLRLDENLDDFYAMCKEKGAPWDAFSPGKGYLLRSPTIFEELVKVIFTTNIQWGGTKRMAKEVVEQFGAPYAKDPTLHAFPIPADIISVPEKEFVKSVRLGYRAQYIYLLASQIENGELNPLELLDSQVSTEEIKKRLLSIKGIGNYAAATMLMLLGRYDQIPLDTVFRDFMKAKYFIETEFSEKKAVLIYEDWGKWKYLAYWYEMIEHDTSSDK